MPEAAIHLSIAGLELHLLTINIVNFTHLLKKLNSDAIADHLALPHIIKSKAEPDTNRIKRL